MKTAQNELNTRITKTWAALLALVIWLVILLPVQAYADDSPDVLLSGQPFNAAIKRLVHGSDVDYTSVDTSVRNIIFCPRSSVKDICPNYESLPSVNVSRDGSSTQAYYDMERQTVYVASASDICLNPYLGYAFSNFAALEFLDLSPLETVEAIYMHAIFFGDKALQSIKGLDRIDVSGVRIMDNMFDRCASLEHLDLSMWDVHSAENISESFQYCDSLKSVDMSGWDTANNQRFQAMFRECHSLEAVTVSSWNTSSADRMHYMFAGCHSLRELDLSGWTFDHVKTFQFMFRDCDALERLVLPNTMPSAVNLRGMFYGCSSLTEIDVSGWDVSGVEYLDYMFWNCAKVRFLDFQGWNTAAATRSLNMLTGTEGLEVIALGDGFSFKPYSLGMSVRDGLYWYEINTERVYATEDIPANTHGYYVAAAGSTQPPGSADKDVFAFPADLKIIEAEAFEGTSVGTVLFQPGLLEIGNDAFRNALHLSKAFIPVSVTYIADSAFPLEQNFGVYGVAGSYAHQWAARLGVPFTATDFWAENSGRKESKENSSGVTILQIPKMEGRIESLPYAKTKSMRPQDRPELYPIDYRFP